MYIDFLLRFLYRQSPGIFIIFSMELCGLFFTLSVCKKLKVLLCTIGYKSKYKAFKVKW